MKSILVFISIVFSFLNLLAQDFAPLGAEWYYSEGFAFDGSEKYLHIKSEKDTVINGIECRKLVKNHGLACSFRPNVEFVYSNSNMVYFWDDDVNEFQILYDFNAEKDSSWQIVLPVWDNQFDTMTVYVDSIDYKQINGVSLKNLHVRYSVSDGEYTSIYPSQILETIGDISYLFNLFPIASLACDGNYSKGLRCYEDSDFGFYSTGIADSCDYIYNWRYDEFAPSGAQWYYSEHAGGTCPGDCEYVHYRSVSDTVILGIKTRKIERTYYQYGGMISQLEPYFTMHEKDTVFLYDPINKEFDKLYVFNVKAGDTLTLDVPYEQATISDEESYRIVIESVEMDEFELYGLAKYNYKALDGFGWISNFYYDHIGGYDWFIPRGAIIPEAGGPIRCYSDWMFNIKFSDVECDHWLTGIEDERYSSLIKVYPNPASHFIQLESFSNVVSVNIYNLNGSLVLVSDDSVISISELDKGVYFLTVDLENGQVVKGQFIKN